MTIIQKKDIAYKAYKNQENQMDLFWVIWDRLDPKDQEDVLKKVIRERSKSNDTEYLYTMSTYLEKELSQNEEQVRQIWDKLLSKTVSWTTPLWEEVLKDRGATSWEEFKQIVEKESDWVIRREMERIILDHKKGETLLERWIKNKEWLKISWFLKEEELPLLKEKIQEHLNQEVNQWKFREKRVYEEENVYQDELNKEKEKYTKMLKKDLWRWPEYKVNNAWSKKNRLTQWNLIKKLDMDLEEVGGDYQKKPLFFNIATQEEVELLSQWGVNWSKKAEGNMSLTEYIRRHKKSYGDEKTVQSLIQLLYQKEQEWTAKNAKVESEEVHWGELWNSIERKESMKSLERLIEARKIKLTEATLNNYNVLEWSLINKHWAMSRYAMKNGLKAESKKNGYPVAFWALVKNLNESNQKSDEVFFELLGSMIDLNEKNDQGIVLIEDFLKKDRRLELPKSWREQWKNQTPLDANNPWLLVYLNCQERGFKEPWLKDWVERNQEWTKESTDTLIQKWLDEFLKSSSPNLRNRWMIEMKSVSLEWQKEWIQAVEGQLDEREKVIEQWMNDLKADPQNVRWTTDMKGFVRIWAQQKIVWENNKLEWVNSSYTKPEELSSLMYQKFKNLKTLFVKKNEKLLENDVIAEEVHKMMSWAKKTPEWAGSVVLDLIELGWVQHAIDLKNHYDQQGLTINWSRDHALWNGGERSSKADELWAQIEEEKLKESLPKPKEKRLRL